MMKELNEKVYESVLKYSKEGDRLASKSKFKKAIKEYYHALELLPIPKEQWDAAIWLYTAIGDSYFLNEDFVKGLEAFLKASSCSHGEENPFILLRIGQCYYELGNIDEAENALFRAYILDGKKIFKSENKKYLKHLNKNYNL